MVVILGLTGLIAGILAIIFGLAVLIWPKVLRLAVGLYFIILGILQIIPNF